MTMAEFCLQQLKLTKGKKDTFNIPLFGRWRGGGAQKGHKKEFEFLVMSGIAPV